jgi:hypothetical protein
MVMLHSCDYLASQQIRRRGNKRPWLASRYYPAILLAGPKKDYARNVRVNGVPAEIRPGLRVEGDAIVAK